jgi:nucleotide-binding universal stress UspA family protein
MAEAVTTARRILVGLDGSHNAFESFDWYLKNVHRPEDYVIVAYSPNVSGSFFSVDFLLPTNVAAVSDAVSNAHKEAKDVRQVLEERLRNSGAQGKVHILSSSNIGHALVKEAEQENVSLIVIGSRGHGVLRRTILGSVSGYIVHHSHIPVLVHPNLHHHKDKRHDSHHEAHNAAH